MNSLLLFSDPLCFRKTRALGPLILLFMFTCLLEPAKGASPVSVSGVYPSLTMYNDEGECGTVFTCGSTYWSHGLSAKDTKVIQITRNVLERLSKKAP